MEALERLESLEEEEAEKELPLKRRPRKTSEEESMWSESGPSDTLVAT